MTMSEMTLLQSAKNIVMELIGTLTKEELAQFPNLVQQVQEAKTKQEVFRLGKQIAPMAEQHYKKKWQHLEQRK